jgi:hypothetical protein
MTAAVTKRLANFLRLVQIVSEGSRSALHHGPKLTSLGAVQDVFIARAERSADSRPSSLETNVTGLFTPVLAK